MSSSSQLKVPTSDKPGLFVNFRKLLLNRCQKEFEKDQDDDEIFEKKQKEMEAATAVRNFIFCPRFPLLPSAVLVKDWMFLGRGACRPSTVAGFKSSTRN